MTGPFCPYEVSVIRPQSVGLKPFPSQLVCSWVMLRAVLRFLYLRLTFSSSCKALCLATNSTSRREARAVFAQEFCAWNLLAPENLGTKSCLYSKASSVTKTLSWKDHGKWKPREISHTFKALIAVQRKTPLSVDSISAALIWFELRFGLFTLKRVLSALPAPSFLFQNYYSLQTKHALNLCLCSSLFTAASQL